MSRLRCPRCGAAAQSGQEYCLECGARLDHTAVDTSGPATRRPRWADGWIAPALLGLVIAVLGTGAAIAISGNDEEPAVVSVATGGSRTLPETVSTLTAPEPTTTAPTTTAPTTTAPPRPPANPAVVSWPRGRRGWTIVLLSLPQANGRDAAAAKAAEARRRGLRRVGVLDSSQYASLHPDYYVVFTGIFDSEPEAASALRRARALFPGGNPYPREIVP